MRTRWVMSVAAVVLAWAGAACTAPTPGVDYTWVCVSSDWPGGSISALPLVVPVGAWLKWDYRVEWGSPGDEFYDTDIWDDEERDLVAGESVPMAYIDSGRCLRVWASEGLVYTVTAVPSPAGVLIPRTQGY